MESEAKRQLRIEENRRRLQALEVPTLGPATRPLKTEKKEEDKEVKKRKREADDELPLEPTRKSRRHTKRQLRAEKLQAKLERRQKRKEEKKRLKKLAKMELKRQDKIKEKKRQKRLEREERLEQLLLRRLEDERLLQQKADAYRLKKKLEWRAKAARLRQAKEDERREAEERHQKWMKIKDWRVRRKLEAREEKMIAKAKKQEQRWKDAVKAKLKRALEKRREVLKTQSVRKRINKRKMDERRLTKLEIKQQRKVDREMMAEEDALSRQREEMDAKVLVEKAKMQEKIKKMQELNRDKYPVRRVKHLPFVRITGALAKSKEKAAALTHELYVDVDAFHAFSLGKQFLPAGKNSVIQALCPSGHTAAFDDGVDIHVWSNAMALLIPAEAAIYLDHLLQEAWIDDERCVFFQWSRTQNVTPGIMNRIFEIEKGDECLRFDDNYYDPPPPIGTPQPLMLFIQFPKGPYIYCGRLGYLGHKSDPLEIYFQLLDIDTIYWAQLRNTLAYCEKEPEA